MLYALLIGINEYNPAPKGLRIAPLKAAVPDIKAIYKLLRRRLGLEPSNCVILSSPRIKGSALPKTDEVMDVLTNFSREPMKADDTFFFYFAGHGINLTEDDYRLLTWDANVRLSNKEDRFSQKALEKSSLLFKDLEDCSRQIRAGKQIIILDACRRSPFPELRGDFVSKIDSAIKREFALGDADNSAHTNSTKQRIFISSCSTGQFAYEPHNRENSWFCENLLACFDALPQGHVDLHDLMDDVIRRMQERVYGVSIDEQTPFIWMSRNRRITLNLGPNNTATPTDDELDAEFACDYKATPLITIAEPQPPVIRQPCFVIPLDDTLFDQPLPANLVLPAGHLFLNKPAGEVTEHYYRIKDSHVAVLCRDPKDPQANFLIDKYAITAKQYQVFLNELILADHLKSDTDTNGVGMCVDKVGRALVFDARDVWQQLPRTPSWKYAAEPWGLTRQSGNWQAIEGAELLPAVFMTGWGARYYSLWAAGRLNLLGDQLCDGLPTGRQWLMAALYDPRTRQHRRYPWGETWERRRVNHAGYWADKEIVDPATWEREWKAHPEIYSRTRPLAVAALDEGRSPSGCLQMLGNVWEWCSDLIEAQRNRHLIKGGDCTSRQEYFTGNQAISWNWDYGSEYIGFRCCWPIDSRTDRALFLPAYRDTISRPLVS